MNWIPTIWLFALYLFYFPQEFDGWAFIPKWMEEMEWLYGFSMNIFVITHFISFVYHAVMTEIIMISVEVFWQDENLEL